MLEFLRIRNFALIDDLKITFQKGFNVLTGETGAGKSIIIGALSIILGEKAGIGLIRSGEKEALVEALFSTTSATVIGHVQKRGLALRQSKGAGTKYIK